MTIKTKISIYICSVFTVLFGIICLFVISIFSNFRKQEFEERLNEKALTYIKLLIDVIEVDKQLLEIIDHNSINQLYNEKTLIFDADGTLIYSSLDDTKIKWSKQDLEYLKEHHTFFKKDGNNEIYGVFYDAKGDHHYFALISANDNYGKRKLDFLIYLLVGAYLIFTIATWIVTFYLVKKQLSSLDFLHKRISDINEYNLQNRIEIKENSINEIDLIGEEFNFMMNRIEEAYQKQKEFTSQASHELRTPLARISAQLENQLQQANDNQKSFILNLFKDITQLNELINSLLILSKIDNKQQTNTTEITRIDEVIFNSIEKINYQYKNFKVNLVIDESENLVDLLEIKANQSLLEIAFTNLLKNAYLYSDNQQATVEILQINYQMQVKISNSGNVLTAEEQQNMFQPFMRGQNAKNHNGLGLGLRIVQRILYYYGFKISYESVGNLNIFVVSFEH